MRYLSSYEIRKMFLNFFKNKDHIVYDSASLIPKNDNSLLWINSGIAALKKEFISLTNKKKIVSCQKCIRTNDIDNVGVTLRHHTFFEMLGNFSIGSYFRNAAIEYSWEFLTSKKYLDLDKEKLFVTVFPKDKDTYNFWKNTINLSEDHIILCEDNFWEIGEGPCGPCTEIFYDRGEKYNFCIEDKELFPGGENDRYVEIWNIVFSQFESKENIKRDEYKELPNKNIDTGMGLERITSIIQDVEDAFSTDLFFPIIEKIQCLTGKKYTKENKNIYKSFRIIADHIRALVFMLGDGAVPSNEDRGYIIRRLLRRSSIESIKLGLKKPSLHELVDTIIDIMSPHYNYLLNIDVKKMKNIIFTEEIKYKNTLKKAEKKFEELVIKKSLPLVTGKEAFKLYDTYGLPLETTLYLSKKYNITVDLKNYDTYMQEQRHRSREDKTKKSENKHFYNIDFSNFNFKKSIEYNPTKFVGYNNLKIYSENILGLFDLEYNNLEFLNEGEKGILIFKQTPFYAEGGGQLSDIGIIEKGNNIACVKDVQKFNDIFFHYVCVKSGQIKNNEDYNLKVDENNRILISCNHTATHLLQYALTKILNIKNAQAGSKISSDKLSFDFEYDKPLSKKKVHDIENFVTDYIYSNIKVTTDTMTLEESKKINAIGKFEKKYKENVRVVSIGKSKELCGGTHIDNTSKIGLFKIISEKSVSSGIRRIEALTNKNAFLYLNNRSMIIDDLKELTKSQKDSELKFNISNIYNLLTSTKKKYNNYLLEYIKIKLVNSNPDYIKGYKIFIILLDDIDKNDLKALTKKIKIPFKDDISIFILISNIEYNSYISIYTNHNKNSAIKSCEIAKLINNTLNTKGGGNDFFSQIIINKIIDKYMMINLLYKVL